MAPAFNSAALKEMYPVFVRKAEELRDCWDRIIDPSRSSIPHPTPSSATPPGEKEEDTPDFSPAGKFSQGIVFDICDWMNRATLDVVGLAGFGYSFDSLTDGREEVSIAFRKIMEAVEKPPGFKAMFALWFPIIDDILVGGLERNNER